jgi:hypothetical protein
MRWPPAKHGFLLGVLLSCGSVERSADEVTSNEPRMLQVCNHFCEEHRPATITPDFTSCEGTRYWCTCGDMTQKEVR